MSFEDTSQRYLEGGYGLGRGYASSLRLNFQHHLFRKLLGYTIHSNIIAKGKLPLHPRIADVGTGTGQWLIDVSHEIPSAVLDGFDISKDQFPNNAWIPSQVSLKELDITRDISPALADQYDVVNVQLFLCVVQKDGPMAILRHIFKMLKPGGYLQWIEYDPISFKVVSRDQSLKQTANEKHVRVIRGPEGIATTWPSNLPSHFHNAGFEQIEKESYPLPDELYTPFMQCHLCAAEEISFTAMRNDGPEAQGPLFRKLLAEVYKECQSGVTMVESPVVVLGRKPPS